MYFLKSLDDWIVRKNTYFTQQALLLLFVSQKYDYRRFKLKGIVT